MLNRINGNRSRYGRDRPYWCRPPVISARDVELFKLLDRYRLLRSGAIRAFFPGSDRGDLLDRLRRLYDFGYVNRLDSVARYRIAREMQSVYELDALGAQELRQRGLLSDEGAGSRMAIGNFHHALMICDVLASIDVGCRGSGVWPVSGDGGVCVPSLRFVPQHEILAKAPCRALEKPLCIPVNDKLKSITPDAIFGLEYDGGNRRYFALEVDRGSEPLYRAKRTQSSLVRKFEQYRVLLASDGVRTHLGFSAPLFPLFVTMSAERLRKLRALLTQLTESKGNSRILFKAMHSDGSKAPRQDGHMLFEPYLRAMYAPFPIWLE